MFETHALAATPGGAGQALATQGRAITAAPAGSWPEAAEEKFSALGVIHLVLRYRKFLAVCAAVGVALGLIMTAMQPVIYQASSRMEVQPVTAKVVEDFQVSRERDESRAAMTARERLLSSDMARRVATDLNLANDYTFLAAGGSRFSGLFGRLLASDNRSEVEKLPLNAREARAIGRLRGALTVRPVAGTNILDLVVRDQVPATAARIADQYIRTYIDYRVETTMDVSMQAQKFIQEQVQSVKGKLEVAEFKLADYAREQNLRLDINSNSLLQADITAVNTALQEVQRKRIEQQHYVLVINEGRAGELPQVLENNGIAGLREKIGELRAQYQFNLATMKPAMPEMQQIQARIRELQRQVTDAAAIIGETIKLSFKEALTKETALQSRLDQLQGDQAGFTTKNVAYTILKREVDSLRSQYQSLISKMNDVGVSSEVRSPTASIVDFAVPSSTPVSPNLWLNTIGALLASLVAAAGIIYVIELLNNSFSRPDQIESSLQMPLLGIIPEVTTDIRTHAADSKSGLNEAYRSLRTAIQFSGQDGAPRVLSVTSTDPSEGKSTTSWRLASEFAALGLRVLVIDADMRKPSLHRIFGRDHNIGLSNLLTSIGLPEEVSNVIQKTDQEGLSFISSGPMPPSPADLLSSGRMSMIISDCKRNFDVTIIDCPPVIGLADAPIIGRISDATILVVGSRGVTRKAALNATRRLRATGSVLIGAALTRFSADRFDYDYDYRYVYSSQYYTYGAKAGLIEDQRDGQPQRGSSQSALAKLVARLRRSARTFVRKYQQT